MTLTAEQKALLEEKRQAALRRREQLNRERGLTPTNQRMINQTNQSTANQTTNQSTANRTTNQSTPNQTTNQSTANRTTNQSTANRTTNAPITSPILSPYFQTNQQGDQSASRPCLSHPKFNQTMNRYNVSKTFIPKLNQVASVQVPNQIKSTTFCNNKNQENRNSSFNQPKPNQSNSTIARPNQSTTTSNPTSSTNLQLAGANALNTPSKSTFSNNPPTNLNNTNQMNPNSRLPSMVRSNNINFNKNNSTSEMTQLKPFNKHPQQTVFTTPGKRPNEENILVEKKRQKSPYDQRLNQSLSSPPTNVSKRPVKVIVRFKLIDNEKFSLNFKYNAKLIQVVKTYESASYDSLNRQWVYNLKFYQKIDQSLRKLYVNGLELKIETGIPHRVITLLADTHKYNEMNVNLEDKIKSIVGKLFPYQREGVKFAVKREGTK